MRKLFIPAALVLSLAAGSAAMAATASTAKPAKTTASAPATSKSGECVKQWKAQKKHDQTRKAFLAACERA
jgi:hypothetical protein